MKTPRGSPVKSDFRFPAGGGEASASYRKSRFIERTPESSLLLLHVGEKRVLLQ